MVIFLLNSDAEYPRRFVRKYTWYLDKTIHFCLLPFLYICITNKFICLSFAPVYTYWYRTLYGKNTVCPRSLVLCQYNMEIGQDTSWTNCIIIICLNKLLFKPCLLYFKIKDIWNFIVAYHLRRLDYHRDYIIVFKL